MKNLKDLTENLTTPLGQLISEVGRGVAEAQQSMDKRTLELLTELYKNDENAHRMLQEIGYRPNWYHIPEAEAELNVSLTVSGDHSPVANKSSNKMRLMASPMNATYQNSFNYKMRASSKLKFKVVPIPEPGESEERQIMPLVNGLTVKEADSLLKKLNIAYVLKAKNGSLINEINNSNGSKSVAKQVPEAGTMFDQDVEVVLTSE